MLKFTLNIPLEESLIFEDVYPKIFQLSLSDKQWLVDIGATFIWMTLNDDLIGETCFIPIDILSSYCYESDLGDGLDEFYDCNAIYVYGTTILPKYQGKGYGKTLKSYFYGYIKSQGYSMVLGHARLNTGSLSLNKLFGATEIGTFENWYGSGEEFILYKNVI